jgi:hypothetical protein
VRRLAIIVSSVFLLACFSFAKTPPPSNPQALAFAAQSIAAITRGVAISDVTLTGNVTWSGSFTPENGTATLLALGTGESKMTLVLSDGTRTEIRDASTGTPEGEWIAETGKSGLFAAQNTMTDAVWFFPVLGSLAAGPNVVLSYVGQETRNGESVQHIQSYIYNSAPSVPGAPTSKQLSTIDFYLDSTTLLPSATVFNAHPDNNVNSNLLIEIDFSNYQVIDGANIPTHIQKSSEGATIVDLTISGALFNSGLPLSDFSIN